MNNPSDTAPEEKERQDSKGGWVRQDGFQSFGLFTKTPWIQDACIRAIVTVPMAFLKSAANVLHEVAGRKWTLQQALALVMSVLMAAPGIAAPAGSDTSQLSAAQITEPLQKAYEELAKAAVGTKEGTQLPPEQVADRLRENVSGS